MGLLRVTAEGRSEITATGARLHVEIEGSTFVLGQAALDKAREVREFAARLQAVGVAVADIHVHGVRVASASGLLTRTQRASFQLVVEVAPALLPEVLGVAAGQPDLRLRQLEWVFDSFEASLPLAAQAMQRARRKADVIAAAAGLRVAGVHSASDSWDMPATTLSFDAAPAGLLRRQDVALDVGVEYSAQQFLRVELTVDFTLE